MDGLLGLAFVGAALAIWTALPLPPAPVSGISAPGLYTALALAAFIVGAAEVFRDNAAQTILPAFVQPEELERANGRLWSAELLTNALIGPALGAMLIGLWLPLAFGLNAVASGFAMLLVAGLAGQFRPAKTGPASRRTGTGADCPGPVLCSVRVHRLCLGHRLCQHATADDPGPAEGASEQPLPAAGLGDDAGRATTFGRRGHLWREGAAAWRSADAALLGGGNRDGCPLPRSLAFDTAWLFGLINGSCGQLRVICN